MAITEESRHNLYQRLEQVLGRDEATTLMEHLPPVGWADVATKRDLEGFAALFRTELAQLGSSLRADMYKQQRDLVLAMIASNATFAALTIAAVRLL